MGNDGAVIVGVGLLVVVGAYFLLRKPHVLARGVGPASSAYLPGRETATIAGIGTIGAIFSKGIDAFMSWHSDNTKAEIAKDASDADSSSSDSSSDDDLEVH